MSAQILRFCIVDDDVEDIVILKDGIEESDSKFLVQYFTDSKEALTHLQSCQDIPDIIIVDYNMPGMNGLVFIEYLRSMPEFDNCPVLMYSTEAGRISEAIKSKYRFHTAAKVCTSKDLQKTVQWIFELVRNGTVCEPV